MRRPRRFRSRAFTATAALSVALGAGALAGCAHPAPTGPHVLLISVDGLHQTDLAGYVAWHPDSALAKLVRAGAEYTHASTPVPSDSFPGMAGMVTGGNPGTTGIYYDSGYDRTLLPPGTTACTGATPGTDLVADESIDRNPDALDAGQGVSNLPHAVLSLTDRPATVLDPAKLPVAPGTCTPVPPHGYLRVNTVFEVARAHGLRTAWADKHPAYDLVSGPSGQGVDDLFTPEIASKVPGGSGDWTSDNADTRRYDTMKAAAVRNEIDGYDHSRDHEVGVPAIMGLNFQSVSTAQKLTASDGLAGGYLADGLTPGPLVVGALDFVDQQIGGLLSELRARHLDADTTVILTAKHGQGPTDPATLDRIDDAPILDALNGGWQATHPGAGRLVAHATDDDAVLLWLTDRSPAALDFVRTTLLARTGTGTDVHGQPRPYTRSGLDQLYLGPDAARFLRAAADDPRVPDVVGVTQPGVVYTGGTKKIAEHGGAAPADTAVPIVVSTEGGRQRTVDDPVETTRIAPTVLRALGLDPAELAAVRSEGTQALG